VAHPGAQCRRRSVHRFLRRQIAALGARPAFPGCRQDRPVDQGRHRDLRRQDHDHAAQVTERGGAMAYAMKELACDPARIKGMSEKLIVSHYENNYGGAVNRLNAIAAQLAELDFAKAPGFVINGLKREELIASNSMILHELLFASLGEESAPEGELRDALAR